MKGKVLDVPKRHFMNPQHAKHMGGSQDVGQHSGQHQPPQIHMGAAGDKMRVTVTHHDGNVETSDHDFGDTDGMKSHIDKHYGQGFQGQGHGIKPEGADAEELHAAY